MEAINLRERQSSAQRNFQKVVGSQRALASVVPVLLLNILTNVLSSEDGGLGLLPDRIKVNTSKKQKEDFGILEMAPT